MPGIEHVTITAGPFTLRPPGISEAADALAMLQDPDVVQWNPAPRVVDLETAAAWCRRGGDWSSGYHATWSIYGSDDRMLGNLSMYGIDRDDQKLAMIGYRTAPWARNIGVASYGVIGACRWAFDVLGIERIELPHVIENPASCRVAVKAGFRCEGTMRAQYRDPSGKRWDCHLHGRLSTDPEPVPT
jgi:RimJ/RimL family protein N-acetyltransferase